MDNLTFDGSNWEDLLRLVTMTNMDALRNPNDYVDGNDLPIEHPKIGFLVKQFDGPALDWVGKEYASNQALFRGPFMAFVEACRDHFGVSDDILLAHRRSQMDALHWKSDLPVFFAEFDRLTQALNIQGHENRINLLRTKLPTTVLKLVAEQALNFQNYDTMRERLLTMWALDPGRHVLGVAGAGPVNPSVKSKRRGGRNKSGGSKN